MRRLHCCDDRCPHYISFSNIINKMTDVVEQTIAADNVQGRTDMCQCQPTATAEQQEVVENRLLPKAYTILAIERHTELEWNFRVSRDFDVHYGQFVEISCPPSAKRPSRSPTMAMAMWIC